MVVTAITKYNENVWIFLSCGSLFSILGTSPPSTVSVLSTCSMPHYNNGEPPYQCRRQANCSEALESGVGGRGYLWYPQYILCKSLLMASDLWRARQHHLSSITAERPGDLYSHSCTHPSLSGPIFLRIWFLSQWSHCLAHSWTWHSHLYLHSGSQPHWSWSHMQDTPQAGFREGWAMLARLLAANPPYISRGWEWIYLCWRNKQRWVHLGMSLWTCHVRCLCITVGCFHSWGSVLLGSSDDNWWVYCCWRCWGLVWLWIVLCVYHATSCMLFTICCIVPNSYFLVATNDASVPSWKISHHSQQLPYPPQWGTWSGSMGGRYILNSRMVWLCLTFLQAVFFCSSHHIHPISTQSKNHSVPVSFFSFLSAVTHVSTVKAYLCHHAHQICGQDGLSTLCSLRSMLD